MKKIVIAIILLLSFAEGFSQEINWDEATYLYVEPEYISKFLEKTEGYTYVWLKNPYTNKLVVRALLPESLVENFNPQNEDNVYFLGILDDNFVLLDEDLVLKLRKILGYKITISDSFYGMYRKLLKQNSLILK